MRRLLIAAVLAAGCGGEPAKEREAAVPGPPPPAKAEAESPRVGAKVLIRSKLGKAVWKDPESAVREAEIYGSGLPYAERTAEAKKIDHRRVGAVSAGDMVEVLEVGEGYLGVDVLSGGHILKGDDGEPIMGRLHGYISRE